MLPLGHPSIPCAVTGRGLEATCTLQGAIRFKTLLLCFPVLTSKGSQECRSIGFPSMPQILVRVPVLTVVAHVSCGS